eukprot:scpid96304/ scgid27483/ 
MRKVDSRLEQISSRVRALTKEEKSLQKEAEDLSAEITKHYEELKEKIAVKLKNEERTLLAKLDKHRLSIARRLSSTKQLLDQEQSRQQQSKNLACDVERVPSQGDRAVFLCGLLHSLIPASAASLSDTLQASASPTSQAMRGLDLKMEWTSTSEYRPLVNSCMAGDLMAKKDDESSECTIGHCVTSSCTTSGPVPRDQIANACSSKNEGPTGAIPKGPRARDPVTIACKISTGRADEQMPNHSQAIDPIPCGAGATGNITRYHRTSDCSFRDRTNSNRLTSVESDRLSDDRLANSGRLSGDHERGDRISSNDKSRDKRSSSPPGSMSSASLDTHSSSTTTT